MPNVNVMGSVVSFPDSMSQDDIQSAIENEVMPQIRKDANLSRGINMNAGDEAKLQGASLGWGIPAQAALTALVDKLSGSKADIGDLYSHYRGVINGAYQNQASQHPALSAADNVIGGALTAPALGALQPLAGAGLGTRMLAGGVTGASAGAVAGAGNAQTQGTNPQMPTLGGAAAGAVMGASAPPLAAAYQALRGPVDALGTYASGTLNKALDAFTADSTTPADALAAMRAGAAAGKPVMPVDVGGQNVQGLGRGAVVLPGPARDQITNALNARAAPGPALQRANADINDLSGGVTPNGTEDAYNSVKDQPVPQMRPMLARVPSYRTAHDAMRARMFEENPDTAPNPLFDQAGNVTRDPTVGDLDMIKRYNDAAFDQATSKLGQGGSPADAAVLSESYLPARQAYLDTIDQYQPGYAAARAAGGMMAATGKLQGIASKAADSALYPNITKAIAGTSPYGEKAGDLLGAFNPDEVSEFQARQALERQMATTRARTLLGSDTAGKAADASSALETAANVPAVVADPVSFLSMGMVRNIANKMGSGIVQRQNQELANGLFSTGQKGEDFLSSLDRLSKARMSGQNISLMGAPATAYTSSQDQGNSY